LRHRGKVRDSYDLPGHPDKMLVVASDRCSIFDFVLPITIPRKGEILTALNHFWTTGLLRAICETDFVAGGAAIDSYLPEPLRNDPTLQKRATVVRILPAPDVEDIVRFVLTGSGLSSYEKTREICGHRLPAGLTNGDFLPYPLYTPTTKAAVGHDEHVTADSVVVKYGHRRERLALQAAGAIASYAAQRGIIMADTKFEFSLDASGKLVLADEKGTPDSSRFVDKAAWQKARAKGQFPPSLDKQYVRELGKAFGIDKLNPEVEADITYVDSLIFPRTAAVMTTRIYRYVFWRLTGMPIEQYQKEKMGIALKEPKRNIQVLVGSESDLTQIQGGLDWLANHTRYSASVISCHRNLEELRAFAKDLGSEGDGTDYVIIAGAGLAAALPGIIKSELCRVGRSDIPVIGVAFKGKTEREDLAAILSIECLPGQPVELDRNGNVYFGHEGFLEACKAAIGHEFMPKSMEPKPARLNIREGG
jgi:phosphoribosylaminoimidazole-succinocarboxamide synthase